MNTLSNNNEKRPKKYMKDSKFRVALVITSQAKIIKNPNKFKWS